MLARSTTSINDAVAAVLLGISVVTVVVLVVGLPWLAHPEVVPLTIVTAFALVGPIWRDRRVGRVDLAEPFTLAVWTVAFWHFVVGTAAYSLGRQDDVFYLERLRGDGRAVVATQALILVGLVAWGLAARSAIAADLGTRLAPRIPTGPTRSRDLQVLTWTMLAVGVSASLIGRAQGTIGYSAVSAGTIGAVTGFGAMMAAVSPIPLVEARRAGASRRATIAMAVGISAALVIQTVVAGNRGTFLSFAIVALIAAGRLRRRVGTRRLVVAGLGGLMLFAGAMAYGSAYRSVATGPDGVVSSDLTDNAIDAVVDLWDRGPGVVGFVTDRMTERLDATISASVVVAQYEELAADERTAEIDNDIARTTVGALVPRALWPDKPSTDPRRLGEVYFGFPNAFATTPIATLLRNFGPLSIALGMALAGLALGIAHASLASATTWTAARAVLYVLCATRAATLEGSFATYLPDASRLAIISVATIVLAWAISRVLDHVGGTASATRGSPTSVDVPAGRTVAATTSGWQLLAGLIALTCVARIAATLV